MQITVEDREAMHIACGKCRRVAEPEYVQKAQELMKTLPARFSMDTDPEEVSAVFVIPLIFSSCASAFIEQKPYCIRRTSTCAVFKPP